MPNEMSIQGVTPLSAAGDTITEPKAEAFVPPSTPPPVVAPQPYVNPSLRLDAALGLVVIEFRDDSGSITSSIPSQRQLEAYRLHEQSPPGVRGDARAAGPVMTGVSGETGAVAGVTGATGRTTEPPTIGRARGDPAVAETPPITHAKAPDAAITPIHKA